jgi:hypothetical protein
MSDFKIGDRVVITGKTFGYEGCLKVGDTAHILEFYSPEGKNVSASMVSDRGASCCFHGLDNIELKPKWSIYNNTLPWSELSDKQKGKLLLASHSKIKFNCNKLDVWGDAAFNNINGIYTAQYIEPVKPEPTMEEMFKKDWHDLLFVDGKFEQQIIARGWKK